MLIPGSVAFTLRRKVGLPQSGVVMSGDHEQRIRTRAYEIWERDSHPEGRAEVHWRQARIEIGQELVTSGIHPSSVKSSGKAFAIVRRQRWPGEQSRAQMNVKTPRLS